MRLMEIFSEEEDPYIEQRVHAAWQFVAGFPLPRFDITCTCGSTDMKVMSFTYYPKDDIHVLQPGGPYRCIMNYKCRKCTGTHSYSMAVSAEIFNLRSEEGQAIHLSLIHISEPTRPY